VRRLRRGFPTGPTAPAVIDYYQKQNGQIAFYDVSYLQLAFAVG
jgi:hypothetical protein